MEWQLIYYKSKSGKPIVEEFVNSLDLITRAKLARQLNLLKTYGNQIGMPHAKPMGNGLMELRVRGKHEVRVLYTYEIGKKIYLLHGFVKKSQSTPKKELDIALNRIKEVKDY